MPEQNILFTDFDEIAQTIESLSPFMYNRVKSNSNIYNYSLSYKVLKHSDLSTRGKRCNGQKVDKNFLYYLSDEEMAEMEARGTDFPTAKQSDINIPKNVYGELKIPCKRGTKLNDYANIYLVNDSLKYFADYYTQQIFTNLGKNNPWKDDGKYTLNGYLTEIELKYQSQGIGSDSPIFSALRLNIFLNDILYCLIETKGNEKPSLYIMLAKNPKFYQILGIDNIPWENKLDCWQQKINNLDGRDEKTAQRIIRELHADWKRQLALEMMNYIHKNSLVICPFTNISGDFNKVPNLFIASHIKRFADSNIKEKYDINNGLLLCANADAMFDKYMITISEDKRLLFSCLIDDDLKEQLGLTNGIIQYVLTDKRMEYMEEHRNIFMQKESIRKLRLKYDDEVDKQEDEVDISIDSKKEISINSISNLENGEEETPSMAAESDPEYAVINANHNNSNQLINCPQDTQCVLVGCFKNLRHLKWINTNLKYNVRIGNRQGAIDIESHSPKYVVIYDLNNHSRLIFFEVNGGKVMDASELNDMGYPQAKEGNKYYVYNLQNSQDKISCDIDSIINNAKQNIPNYKKGCPIYINL